MHPQLLCCVYVSVDRVGTEYSAFRK